MNYFLILLPILSCLCLQAGELAEEELNVQRQLTAFQLQPYINELRAANDFDDYDDGERIEYDGYGFIDDPLQQESIEEIARKAERARQEKARIERIEGQILHGIQRFIERNPTHRNALVRLCRTHENDYFADISDKIGNHFRASGRFDDAHYFYDLANKGYLVYTNNGCQSSQGYMHLDLYNREVQETNPRNPTSSMFYNLKQSIAALSAASQMDELAEFAIRDLQNVRNMIVRWYLHPQSLRADTYYGRSNNLVRRIYARGFVQRTLRLAESFVGFKNAKRYDGSMSNADLAKYLVQYGFCGVRQQAGQHNWVHPSGFMVRIKRKVNLTAEFTIGITFEDPLIRNENGTPEGLKRYSNGSRLIFDPSNEILKIAYSGRGLFVIPAFRAYYWFDYSQVDRMMGCAHFPLSIFGNATEALLLGY